MGFDLPKGGVTHQQAVALNKAIEQLPSTSDVTNVDVTELQEYADNIDRSAESLIDQLEGESSVDFPMHELLGMDKQLRSIRGSLKVEVA